MRRELLTASTRSLCTGALLALSACSENSSVSGHPQGPRQPNAISPPRPGAAHTPAGLDYQRIAAHPASTAGPPLPIRRRWRDIYGVESLIFSPDGRRLASGCGSYSRTSNTPGRVTLWDPATGQPLAKSDGYRTPIQALAFTPDGLMLASSSGESKVILWDFRKPGGHHTLKVDVSPHALVFAADSKSLAVSNIGSVDWYDTASGKRIRRWRMQRPLPQTGVSTSEVYALALSADGRFLAADDNEEICCWNTATGQVVAVGSVGFAPTLGVIRALAFSPCGNNLASSDCTNDGGLLLWRLRPTIKDGGGQVRSLASSLVAFSPDGRWLAWSGAGEIRIWDMESRSLCRRWQSNGLNVSAVAFSPDGKTLATADYDRTITLWDASVLPAPIAVRPTGHLPLLTRDLARIAPPSGASAGGAFFQSTMEPRTQW